MKKFMITLMVLLMVFSLGFALLACDKDEPVEPPMEEVEEKTPGELLWEAVMRAGASENVNFSQAMNFAISGAIDLKKNANSNSIAYEIKANIDSTDNANKDNNNFYFRLFERDANKDLLGVYADGSDIYIDIADMGYKWENVTFNHNGGGAADGEGDANRKQSIDIETIVNLVGSIAFQKGETNGESYRFEYNIGTIVEAYLPLIGSLAGIEPDSLAMELGYTDFEAMVADLNNHSGYMTMDFDSNRFNRAEFNYNGGDNGIGLVADDIAFNNGSAAIDYPAVIPQHDYVVTKAINFNMNGDIELNGDNGRIAKYTWKLLADIDPFNPSDDDMLHFVVYNKTADNAPEYNDTKIKATDGVMLDVLYSPKDFGTNNVLVAANLKALLSKSVLESLGVPSVAGNLLPNYYGTHIDSELISNIGSVGKVSERGKSRSVFDIFDYIGFGNGTLELHRELLESVLGADMVAMLLDTGADKLDKLALSVNYTAYGANNVDYNAKEQFLYLANDDGSIKNFGAGFKPAKSSEILSADGYVDLTNVYGESFNTGVKSLTYSELSTLIGGKIKYKFKDFFDGEYNANNAVKIMGISGVDKSLIGTEQEISIITSMTDGNNLLGLLDTFKANIELPTNVFKIKVKLVEELSAEITPQFDEMNYKIGDTLNLSHSDYKLTIMRGDGTSAEYNAINYSHNVPLDSSSRFIAAGTYSVMYDFGSRAEERKITVTAPDSIEFDIVKNLGIRGNNTPDNYGEARLIYGEDTIVMPIGKDKVSLPGGAVVDNKLAVYGEYFINVNAYGKQQKARVSVSPLSNRYSIALGGNADSLVVDISTAKVNDIAPTAAKYSLTLEKKTILGWSNQGDVAASVDGVDIKDYRINLPYVGGKSHTITPAELTNTGNTRVRLVMYDNYGIEIANSILEFTAEY